MPNDEQKLRERAYQLWMQDGCKEGRSDQYWFQAEREFHTEGNQAADLSQPSPQPSSHMPRAPKRRTAGGANKAGQKSPMRSRSIQSIQAGQPIPG
jgi:hypothetical protein